MCVPLLSGTGFTRALLKKKNNFLKKHLTHLIAKRLLSEKHLGSEKEKHAPTAAAKHVGQKN